MVEDRLHCFVVPFKGELWARDRRGPYMGGVFRANFRWVHANFLGQYVDDAFHAKRRDGRSWCPVSSGFRTVRDNVVSNRMLIFNVIRREPAQAAVHDGGARKGTGLKPIDALRRSHCPVLFDAHFDGHGGTRGRPRRLENFVPGHGDTHG